MGIPSPLIAPREGPLLRFKPLSPELATLESLKELAVEDEACGDLPPCTVDMKSSCGAQRKLKSNTSWADTKDSDGSDSGDEHDDHSESSTGLRDNESLESRSNSSGSKINAQIETVLDAIQDVKERQPKDTAQMAVAPASPADLLQTKGVVKIDASSIIETQSSSGALMQLLCRIRHDWSSGMFIEPCTSDDVQADCEHEVFWCIVEPQLDGVATITPCVDADVCGVDVDANGVALHSVKTVAGAPMRPSQGSYTPPWVYGMQWPFCAAPTTLILSNLPNHLQQEDLSEILDKEGFSGFYDFLHLPMDVELNRNLGYAVVDLTRHEYALALSSSMHGRASWCGTSSSACQVTWSVHLQGLAQLIEHYQGHMSCSENVPLDMRPTMYSRGWPRPLPLES